MKREKIRIVMNEIGHGECWIGDKNVSSTVYAVEVSTKIGDLTKVTLHTRGPVEFEGPAEITTIADEFVRTK